MFAHYYLEAVENNYVSDQQIKPLRSVVQQFTIISRCIIKIVICIYIGR